MGLSPLRLFGKRSVSGRLCLGDAGALLEVHAMSRPREVWTRFVKGGMNARAAVNALLENDWQEQVEQLAGVYGWKKYHTRDSRGSDEDFPDLLMLRSNADGARLVVAELKREGENPSNGQKDWLELFSAVGAETFVWRPSDLPTVAKVLR